MIKPSSVSIEQKIRTIESRIKELSLEYVSEKLSDLQPSMIYGKVVIPIKRHFSDYYKNSVLNNWFFDLDITIFVGHTGSVSEKKVKEMLLENPRTNHFRLCINTKGFKHAGISAFTCWKDVNIYLNDYTYLIKDGHSQTNLFESLYGKLPTKKDFIGITNYLVVEILEQTFQQLDRIKY